MITSASLPPTFLFYLLLSLASVTLYVSPTMAQPPTAIAVAQPVSWSEARTVQLIVTEDFGVAGKIDAVRAERDISELMDLSDLKLACDMAPSDAVLRLDVTGTALWARYEDNRQHHTGAQIEIRVTFELQGQVVGRFEDVARIEPPTSAFVPAGVSMHARAAPFEEAYARLPWESFLKEYYRVRKDLKPLIRGLASDRWGYACRKFLDSQVPPWYETDSARAVVPDLINVRRYTGHESVSSPPNYARLRAVDALGRIRDRRAIAALTLALAGMLRGSRERAEAALGRIDPNWCGCAESRAALGELTRRLMVPEAHEITLALLDRIDPDWRASQEIQPATKKLILASASDISHEREQALRALSAIDPSWHKGGIARDSVPELAGVVLAADGRMEYAILALDNIDAHWLETEAARGIVPLLLKLFGEPSHDPREPPQFLFRPSTTGYRLAIAARILGRIGDARAVDALISSLNRSDAELSAAAYTALKRITGQDFGPNSYRWIEWRRRSASSRASRTEFVSWAGASVTLLLLAGLIAILLGRRHRGRKSG